MKFHHQTAAYKAVVSLFLLCGITVGAAKAQDGTTPAIKPGTSEELENGGLVFQVTSLRVSPRPESGGDIYSTATVSMRIRNTGDQALPLCVLSKSIRLVNDLGYTWYAPINRSNDGVTGLYAATATKASLDYVVDPGREIRVQMQLLFRQQKQQTLGSSYDFAAEFAAYRDMGEGQLKQTRVYPVSFVGLQRSGALQGAADDVKNIGSDAKRALGSLFGK